MNRQKAIVDSHSTGMRLDLFVTRHLPDSMKHDVVSRSGIQKLISEGQITLNGKVAKSGARLKINDLVAFETLRTKKSSLMAEPIALNIIHEDDDCIVSTKLPEWSFTLPPAEIWELWSMQFCITVLCKGSAENPDQGSSIGWIKIPLGS